MAKLKRVSEYKSKSKKAIILGKGNSLFKYKYSSEDIVFSLNTAGMHLNKLSFLIMNDIETIFKFKESKKLNIIENIICPIQPHKNCWISNFTYLNLLDLLKDENINIFTYNLQTQRIKVKDERIDDFKLRVKPLSSLHTAIQFLPLLEFENVSIYGCSKNKEYSKVFVNSNDTGSKREESWYKENNQMAIDMLKFYKINHIFN